MNSGKAPLLYSSIDLFEKTLAGLNDILWDLESVGQLAEYLRNSGTEACDISYGNLLVVFQGCIENTAQKVKGLLCEYDREELQSIEE